MPRLFYLLYRLATDLISLISRFSDDFLAKVYRHCQHTFYFGKDGRGELKAGVVL